MLAVEYCPDVVTEGTLPNHELLEIHRSKISLHHAKADYDYPTIRLPHYLSPLAGLRTHIYQTVHDGALAFLVVISSADKAAEEITKKAENAKVNVKSPRLDMPTSDCLVSPATL